MAYFNSFLKNIEFPRNSNPTMNNPLLQTVNQYSQNYNTNSNQNIDIKKLKQALPQLDDNKLQRLVAQARLQGVSEQDIEAGLQIIQQLKFSS
jgi:hypothetical protein